MAGDPLGLSALFESQRRLSALGLFRRVRITDVGEPGESARDVIVTVDEAPATMIGYGAGLEAGRRAGTDVEGNATEKVDFAARGFFEVSRRNLFGSNRIATLFTRGSLRPQDGPDGDTSFGFNEYRVVATLRDPASFGVIDTQISGYFEQAVRTSFNFRRRGLQAEFARRVRRDFTLVGSYALSHTELYDERISDEERPDIDRLFPQVRLSVFSAAARRDRRNDILDPTSGNVIGLDTDVAVRALGSEVGFVKGFGEYYWYKQLPRSRAVFATGARLGLAKGFPREVPREIDGVPVIGPDGNELVDRVTDLPASERFFAGGDTTVRGYARDTLGDQATISRGFPRGGNALIIFNGELRVPVWRDIGSAVFLDVGNVFARVSEIELSHLRPTAGFGLRYKSPIGPIRVDLGFKLDRGRFDLVPGDREPLWEFHISIGQAF
jgi:outer membrane protein insertion porin family